MRRRRLLALVGSLATASGCTGTRTNPTSGQTVTPVPVPEPTDRDEQPEQFSITGPAVQPGIVYTNTPDSIGVADDAGQYVRLTVAGDVPDREDFEFRFDEETYAVEERRPYGKKQVRYEGNTGPMAFALPETGDAADAGLVWPGGQWTPPAQLLERLAEPLPPLSVALDGPETAAEGDEPVITVEVTNDGETTGRYILALNRMGPDVAYAPVDRLVGELPSGITETRRVDALPPQPGRPTEYRLDAPGREADLTHTITAPE